MITNFKNSKPPLFKIITTLVLLLVAFAVFVFWFRTDKKFVTGLNGGVSVRLNNNSTASEKSGIFTVNLTEGKRIEISRIENKFPQAKTAKEYNELDRKDFETNQTGPFPTLPGFTDVFIQEIEKKNSNWDSAIEVKAFHLASSQGLKVRKFLVLKGSNIYEVYFIFPPNADYSDLVVPSLQYSLMFK